MNGMKIHRSKQIESLTVFFLCGFYNVLLGNNIFATTSGGSPSISQTQAIHEETRAQYTSQELAPFDQYQEARQREQLPLSQLEMDQAQAKQGLMAEMTRAKAVEKRAHWQSALTTMKTFAIRIPLSMIFPGAFIGAAAGQGLAGREGEIKGFVGGLALEAVVLPFRILQGTIVRDLAYAGASIALAPAIGLGDYGFNRLRVALRTSPITIKTLQEHAPQKGWLTKLKESFAASEAIKSKLPQDLQDKITLAYREITFQQLEANLAIEKRRKTIQDKKEKHAKALAEQEAQRDPLTRCQSSRPKLTLAGIKNKVVGFIERHLLSPQWPSGDAIDPSYGGNLDTLMAQIDQDKEALDARCMKAKIKAVEDIRKKDQAMKDKEQRLAQITAAKTKYQQEMRAIKDSEQRTRQEFATAKKSILNDLKEKIQATFLPKRS